MVECDTQAEIDRLWDGLLAHGGTAERCGWLRDRWGLAWQIVPRRLIELIDGSDRERARRVTDSMLRMVKLDLAALEAAATGASRN
jgi:predicted 3-demethylubiquinone-9 3-methyltransferase (glyoxalase superfamily)